MADSANTRLNNIWEKLSIGLLGILLGWMQIQYQDSREQVKELETKVQTLYLDKVSKSDLKDVEVRINDKIDGMKTDLLARLDWYFLGQRDKQKPQ